MKVNRDEASKPERYFMKNRVVAGYKLRILTMHRQSCIASGFTGEGAARSSLRGCKYFTKIAFTIVFLAGTANATNVRNLAFKNRY